MFAKRQEKVCIIIAKWISEKDCLSVYLFVMSVCWLFDGFGGVNNRLKRKFRKVCTTSGCLNIFLCFCVTLSQSNWKYPKKMGHVFCIGVVRLAQICLNMVSLDVPHDCILRSDVLTIVWNKKLGIYINFRGFLELPLFFCNSQPIKLQDSFICSIFRIRRILLIFLLPDSHLVKEIEMCICYGWG